MERRCLRCDGRFMAKGRFNRICPRCRQVIDYAVLEYSGNFRNAIYHANGFDLIVKKPHCQEARSCLRKQ